MDFSKSCLSWVGLMKLASRMPEKTNKTKYTSFFLSKILLWITQWNISYQLLLALSRMSCLQLSRRAANRTTRHLSYPLSRSKIKLPSMRHSRKWHQTLPKLGCQVNYILGKIVIEVDTIPNLMGNKKYRWIQWCSMCATLYNRLLLKTNHLEENSTLTIKITFLTYT